MARRRHLSRIAVMQVLFEHETRPQIDPVLSLSQNEQELGEMDKEFAEALLNGVLANQDKLYTLIQEHAPGWTLERMDPVSRAVLCMGAYEMTCTTDAPPAVIINEAIEIAKEFGTDESGKFVNGVLNSMIVKKDN